MSWLSAAMLLVTLVLLGGLAGGLVVTRIIGTSGMGWDQIADTLAGLMVGGALGFGAWIVAVRMASAAVRLRLTVAAVTGCVAVSISLLSMPTRVRSGRPVDVPDPAVASFTWQIGVADGLAGPPPDSERLPWAFLRIASNLSLDYVPADRTDRHCTAVINTPEGIAALTELRAHLAALPSQLDCGEPCPRCMEVSLQWFLDQPRALMITDRCWRSHEALTLLRATVERVFATYGGTAECESLPP
jgi:hypothetical protein